MRQAAFLTPFLVISMSVAPVVLAAAPLGAGPLGRAIDAYVRTLVERDQLSGQLLVARHGKVLVERQYGFADWELRIPVTPETRFCIASVTKPMTGTIAIQLLASSTIGLKDSIARWLPGFPRGDRITIEQLLRHRSGIPHELMPDSEATRPMTPAAMVEIAARRPFDHEPGARGGYSSGGFTVLTRVLEIASGRSYAELLSERIFAPLGMTHTTDHDSRALLPGRARAVRPGARGLENASFEDFSHIVGAGSVWSTARDLHRFVQGVATGKLGPGPQGSYVRGGKLDFNGITGGFRAFCVWDSASGLEVVFAGNLPTGAPELLKRAIPRIAAGEALPPASIPTPARVQLGAEELGRFEGTFQLENGVRLVVRRRGGVLWANDWTLLPIEGGAFFSPRDYGTVRGVRSADGRIERLDWEQGGVLYPAPRVAD